MCTSVFKKLSPENFCPTRGKSYDLSFLHNLERTKTHKNVRGLGVNVQSAQGEENKPC